MTTPAAFTRDHYCLHRTGLYVYRLTDGHREVIGHFSRPAADTARDEALDGVSLLVRFRPGLGRAASVLKRTSFTFAMADGKEPVVMTMAGGVIRLIFTVHDAQGATLGRLVYHTFRMRWELQDGLGRKVATCRQPVGLWGAAATTDYRVTSTSGVEVATFQANDSSMHARDRWDLRIAEPIMHPAVLIGLVVASDFIVPR
jgi:hypothetical protein